MKRLAIFLLFTASLWGQKNAVLGPVSLTASGQTSAPININSYGTFTSGSISVTGVGLTTATLAVQVSKDNGVTYNATALEACGVPGTFTTTVTVTAQACYEFNLQGVDHYYFQTSGTFTATSVSITLTASPNGQISRGGGGGGAGGAVASVFGRTGSVGAQSGDYTAAQVGADASGVAAALVASAGFQGAWSSSLTYQQGVLISSGGFSYYSLQGGNINNPPASSPTYWTLQPIGNNNLASAFTTVNGQNCSLGGSCTVSVTNLAGQTADCWLYQSAVGTTGCVAAPTTAGTYVYGAQPAGSAVAPTALNLATAMASVTPATLTTSGTATAHSLTINGTAAINSQLVFMPALLQGSSTIPGLAFGTGTGSAVATGGTNLAGTFTSTTSGTIAFTLTWAGSLAYAHRGVCWFTDETTHADLIQTSSATTTTLTAGGTTVSGDTISYGCPGY